MSTSKTTPSGAQADAATKVRHRRILWINIGAVVAFVVVVAVIVFSFGTNSSRPAASIDASGAAVEVVREDSHVLGKPGATTVTLVEFLDFECEACGAAYPFVESLREKYAGQVTFVARYFPIPSHKNALNAAIAAEAAARQGQFEQMYTKLFETQKEWGEQQDSRAPLFRQFADDLGLDLAQFDADVADAAVRDRVLSDQNDGTALGVTGTPTFFLNGELLQPESADDLIRAIDDALGR